MPVLGRRRLHISIMIIMAVVMATIKTLISLVDLNIKWVILVGLSRLSSTSLACASSAWLFRHLVFTELSMFIMGSSPHFPKWHLMEGAEAGSGSWQEALKLFWSFRWWGFCIRWSDDDFENNNKRLITIWCWLIQRQSVKNNEQRLYEGGVGWRHLFTQLWGHRRPFSPSLDHNLDGWHVSWGDIAITHQHQH